ncbi:hypothetical protein [Nocardia sp. XZ_19_385]|uniref:hypothetical protein n=1 Tax=Nocardia sp. XZ_19_385 TaxID=2769488 RepID=UPI00188F7F63|nr:hypothetical protein [Nocardia sp. XZ_19_385]
MSGQWRKDPAPQGYTVTRFDRSPGTGHHALQSMAGPEFTGVGAVYAPLGVLPLGMRLAAFALLLLVGMAGCTAAWIDYQDYTPSPNICRSATAGVPPERPGSCVPSSQVPEVRQ